MKRLQLLFVLPIVLGISELSLRAIYGPPLQGKKLGVNVTEPDPELGWVNKPGKFDISLTPTQSVWASHSLDGARATSASYDDSKPKLVTLGCSFTWGANLPDEETYPWTLQTHLKDLSVVNIAARGYSTYQALLSEERYFKKHDHVSIALYAFHSRHLIRNVADFHWVSWLAMGSKFSYPSLPFVELSRKEILVRKEPTQVSTFILSKYSTLFSLLEVAWNRVTKPRYSNEQLSVVAVSLVREMRALAEKHGARFAVVDLTKPNDTESKIVRELLRQNGIERFECGRNLTEQDYVPDAGHPNGGVNRDWADCIHRELLTRHWVRK